MTSRRTKRGKARQSSKATISAGLWQRGRWWFIGGAATAGAIAVLTALTLVFAGPQRPQTTGQEIGLAQTAPDMTLETLDGEFRLSENRGEVVLLYFSFPG